MISKSQRQGRNPDSVFSDSYGQSYMIIYWGLIIE